MIRTILVDDEPLALQGLELRLQAHSDVDILAQCRNGREAIKQITLLKPDLVFLDIHMPGFDGFGVVRGLLEIDPSPFVVFVTALDSCAVRAFEADAVDYLLKPVDSERLAIALSRVRNRMAERRARHDVVVSHNPTPHEAPTSFQKIINVKDRGKIFRVPVETIERIDAAGDYACLHTGQQTLVLRETMKVLEKRLDPRMFQRIHRSTIVNLHCVRAVKPHSNGECILVLQSGAEAKVSRTYRDVSARFV